MGILENPYKSFAMEFGTGYSSLGYLKSFGIDIIKLDRSFIKDITDEENSQGFWRAVE